MSKFNVNLNHENQLVTITVAGEVFQKDGEEIITIARTTAAQHGYNLLYDMRQAKTSFQFVGWFELPRKLDVFKHLETRRVKAAILIRPDDNAAEGYKFYETVTGNVGISLRIFHNEDEAVKWLTGKSPADK